MVQSLLEQNFCALSYQTVSICTEAVKVSSRVTTGASRAAASAAMSRSCISGISGKRSSLSSCALPRSDSSIPAHCVQRRQQIGGRDGLAQLGR